MKWQNAIVRDFDQKGYVNEMYILTALVAFAGSFVQSSSGFGYAIICMAIWPMFMPFYTASILEAIAAFFMVIYIAVRLWKFIDWKLLLPPVIMATVTSFLGVNPLMALDEDVLSNIMGTVLLILAVYLSFFSSKVQRKASLVSGSVGEEICGTTTMFSCTFSLFSGSCGTGSSCTSGELFQISGNTCSS